MSDVSSRIAQIAAQLGALRAGSPPAGSASRTAATGIGTAATGTTTSATGADATASGASFNDVLATAISGQLPDPGATGPATSGASANPASSAALVAARMALTGLPGATPTTAPTAAATTTSATARAGVPAKAPHEPVAASYPTDLSAYGNGRIPTTALKPLGVGDHRLWAPAADRFRALRAAAARDGVLIGVNDSYRSYAEQVDMARRKGLYSQGGLAAVPGTSEHGLGKSVDLQLDSRALAWMRTQAGQYGFRNNVRGESWHWTYTGRS